MYVYTYTHTHIHLKPALMLLTRKRGGDAGGLALTCKHAWIKNNARTHTHTHTHTQTHQNTHTQLIPTHTDTH